MTSIIAALIAMLTVLSKYWITGIVIFGIVVIVLCMSAGEKHESAPEDIKKTYNHTSTPLRPVCLEKPVQHQYDSAEQLVKSTRSYGDIMGDYKSSITVNSLNDLYQYIAEPTFIRTISEERLIRLLNGEYNLPFTRDRVDIGMFKMEGHNLYTTIIYKEERR